MRGNGKIFISHTHEDNERCAPLLAALDAWGVDYWFDAEQLAPGQQLSDSLQVAVADRDVFLRICSASSSRSYWMTLELNAFRGLQFQDQRGKDKNKRISINLILDPGYVANLADRADVVVDGTNKPRRQTFDELRAVLDLPSRKGPKSGVSRRSVVGLGVAGLVTAGALTSGAVLLHAENSAPEAQPYPKPKVIAFGNPQTTDARVKWYFKAGDPKDSPGMGLALAKDGVYINTGDGFFALNPTDGAILWMNAQITGNANYTPQIVGDTVYVGDFTGTSGVMYALKRADGKQVWRVVVESTLGDTNFTIASGTIYTLNDKGFVVAYNTSNGAKRWQSANSIGNSLLNTQIPVSEGAKVYIGSPDGNLYAFSAMDGSALWHYQSGGEVAGAPAVANGVVYFGSKDQRLYAVNTADGSLLWRYSAGQPLHNSPTIAGNVAYIGLNNYLVALDAHTGKRNWQAPAGDPNDFGNYFGGTVVVSGDRVYGIAGDNLFAFSIQQRKYLWQFKISSDFFGGNAEIAVGDSLYLSDGALTLYALDASQP